MTSLVEMGMLCEGQVRNAGDKPCGEGKYLAEEGLFSREDSKPKGEGTVITLLGTGHERTVGIGDKPGRDGNDLRGAGQGNM